MANFFSGLAEGIQSGRNYRQQKEVLDLERQKIEYMWKQDTQAQQNIDRSYGLNVRRQDMNEETQRIQNELVQLKFIQQQKKEVYEQQKDQYQKDLLKSQNDIKNSNAYFANSSKISNPMQRQIYNESIKNTSFFKQMSPKDQSFVTAISEMPLQQNNKVVKTMNDFFAAQGENDINKMQSTAIMAAAEYGNNPNPAIQSMIKSILELSGVTPIESALVQGEARGGGPTGESSSPLTKTNRSKIQMKLYELNEISSGLNEIKKDFDPKFFTGSTQLKTLWLKLKEGPLGMKLSKKDKTLLKEFSVLAQDTMSTLTTLRKQLTGVAFSKREAEDYQAQFVNLTAGKFKRFFSDSPTEATAKLEKMISKTNEAINRASYAYQYGIVESSEQNGNIFKDAQGNMLKLSDFKNKNKLIDARGNVLYQELKQQTPDMPEEEIISSVTTQLQKEFPDYGQME